MVRPLLICLNRQTIHLDPLSSASAALAETPRAPCPRTLFPAPPGDLRLAEGKLIRYFCLISLEPVCLGRPYKGDEATDSRAPRITRTFKPPPPRSGGGLKRSRQGTNNNNDNWFEENCSANWAVMLPINWTFKHGLNTVWLKHFLSTTLKLEKPVLQTELGGFYRKPRETTECLSGSSDSSLCWLSRRKKSESGDYYNFTVTVSVGCGEKKRQNLLLFIQRDRSRKEQRGLSVKYFLFCLSRCLL